jgi:hypothetical protein
MVSLELAGPGPLLGDADPDIPPERVVELGAQVEI